MQDLIHKLILDLPDENVELMPGVRWGNCCQLFTPAFWKIHYGLNSNNFQNVKLGHTILEEIVACLLGGYGIPAEMGLLAFDRLRKEELIKPGVKHSVLLKALSKPFELSTGRKAVYRFYNQKSQYIHSLLQRNDLEQIPVDDDLNLRNWLLTADGIGLKTASWITRNWLGSDKVAILDIHILRAGKLAGFFRNNLDVSKDYCQLESKYLGFCEAINVQASIFDAIIWDYMKKNNRFAIQALNS